LAFERAKMASDCIDLGLRWPMGNLGSVEAIWHRPSPIGLSENKLPREAILFPRAVASIFPQYQHIFHSARPLSLLLVGLEEIWFIMFN